jgi:uncharacterized protein YjbI with pentapeptide repeats
MTNLLIRALSLVFCLWIASSGPVYAASSAAIRAFDDVTVSQKNFAGQNLQQAEFNDARLEGADFSNADLRGAVFNAATLKQANLQGVDMSDGLAYLSNFAGANLSNGVFQGALLLKSTFRDAIVTGADFSDAVLDKEQVVELCKSASGVNVVTGVETRESLGCV